MLGCLIRYADAGLAELLALQGFDFLIFDGEHGTLTPSGCEHMARAAELHGVTPGVRVEANRPEILLRYLDAGARICHVPQVSSAAAARAAVRAVKFHPHGERGLAPSRASGFGPRAGYEAYTARANVETRVVVHIETEAGAAAAAEIAAVDGVDVLFFGALDLSHDIGLPGQTAHPRVAEARDRIAAAAASSGKAFGAVAADREAADALAASGAGYLLTTVEAVLAPGISDLLGDRRA